MDYTIYNEIIECGNDIWLQGWFHVTEEEKVAIQSINKRVRESNKNARNTREHEKEQRRLQYKLLREEFEIR